MYTLRSSFFFSSRRNPKSSFLRIDSLSHYFFSLSSSSSRSQASAPDETVVKYLIDTFKLSPAAAVSTMNNRSGIKSTQKPQSVFNYLSDLGLSHEQIQSAIRHTPKLAFSSVENTLKPKIEFFRNLGLVGSDLGNFLSVNSFLLTVSLSKKLIPSVEILKSIFPKDEISTGLLQLTKRGCDLILRCPDTRLLMNINYLQSCGVADSHLIMLMKNQPALFAKPLSQVRDMVSMVVHIGFSTNTKMFAHGLRAICGVTNVTFKKKVDLICSFGITEDQCMKMFTSAPLLIRTSIGKLKIGLEFFLNEDKLSRSVIVGRPSCLMLSMQGRVLPRYRVLQLVNSKRLLLKKPSLLDVLLKPSNKDFLDKFVYRFPDDSKCLLAAFRGQCVDVDVLKPKRVSKSITRGRCVS